MTSILTGQSSKKFQRHNGPIGGVAAGLGRTFGVNASFIRLAIVLATVLSGPTVLAIYVALWYAMPVDQSVPVADRPESPPILLVILLALFFGVGYFFDFVFGLATFIGSISLVGWVLMAALVAVMIRSRK